MSSRLKGWDAVLPRVLLFVWGVCVCVCVCVAEWESVSARRRSSVLCLSQQREPAATAAAYITISDVAPQATPLMMETNLEAEVNFYFSLLFVFLN